jgi:hypothetical protein
MFARDSAEMGRELEIFWVRKSLPLFQLQVLPELNHDMHT